MKKLVKLSFLASLVMGTASVQAAETFVTIGTGGQTGVYYVVGQSICQLVNRDSAKTGLKCNAPSTGASVANLNAIAAKKWIWGLHNQTGNTTPITAQAHLKVRKTIKFVPFSRFTRNRLQ